MPVHIATVNGKKGAVKMLVERCRKTLEKATNRMETLLHLAVMANCLGCVHYLIDQGVNLNLKDENGNTCLHLAAAKRNCQVLTNSLHSYLHE
jgi:ankyrin repeat protein